MDDLSALRELGSQLAADNLEPPADLRRRVLEQATVPQTPWCRRRARSLALLGAAAATCAVIAGTAVFADRHDSGQPSTPQITDTPNEKKGNAGQDCSAGTTYSAAPQDMKDLLYLPPAAATGSSRDDPSFARSIDDCTPATTGATWYSLDANGRVNKTLTITGPDKINPYTQNSGLITNDTKSTVDINGQEGILYYSTSEPWGRLYWTLPDGTNWHVEAVGMNPAQVVASAESITIDEQAVATDPIPTGLADRLTSQPPPATLKTGMEASFSFSPTGTKKPVLKLTLRPAGAIPGAPSLGSRPIDINGTAGWIGKGNRQGQVWISWSPATGVHASMTVDGTPARAIELARSTRKVSLSDPRLHE